MATFFYVKNECWVVARSEEKTQSMRYGFVLWSGERLVATRVYNLHVFDSERQMDGG